MRSGPSQTAVTVADSVTFTGAGGGANLAKAETAGVFHQCRRISVSVDANSASILKVQEVVAATPTDKFKLDIPVSTRFELLFPGGLPTGLGNGMTINLAANGTTVRLNTLIQ